MLEEFDVGVENTYRQNVMIGIKNIIENIIVNIKNIIYIFIVVIASLFGAFIGLIEVIFCPVSFFIGLIINKNITIVLCKKIMLNPIPDYIQKLEKTT